MSKGFFHNGNGESGDVVFRSIVGTDGRVGGSLVLINLGEIDVAVGADGLGLSQENELLLIGRFGIDGANHVIGALDEHVPGAPGNVDALICFTEGRLVGSPVIEPVITGVTVHHDVSSVGVRHDEHGRNTEVIVVAATRAKGKVAFHHLGGDSAYHGFQGTAGFAHLLYRGDAGRECFLNTASGNKTSADKDICKIFELFHNTISSKLEFESDTAGQRSDREIGSKAGTAGEGTARVKAPADRPVEHILTCSIQTEALDTDLAGPLGREGVSEVDVLDVQVAGICHEAVGGIGGVDITIYEAGNGLAGGVGSPGLQNIYVEVGTGATGGRRAHEGGITTVIGLSANLVGEINGKVQTLPFKMQGKAGKAHKKSPTAATTAKLAAKDTGIPRQEIYRALQEKT